MRTSSGSPSPSAGTDTFSRREALGRAAGIGAAVAAVSALGPATASANVKGFTMSQATPATAGTPTVVLVHGAFADSAGWSGVITSLQKSGVPVRAISNPLRGVSADAAYVASAVSQIEGPVLLVGHSYGGVVISVVGAQATNVVGLVYVAAFVPDEGETVLGLLEQFPPTLLGAALRPATYPTGDPAAPGTEFYIDPAEYVGAFAADLPEEMTSWLAVSQRPASGVGFGEPVPAIAWKILPSWYAIATGDQAVGLELERFFAERAGSISVEIDASHSVFVSQPEAIADLIRTALGSIA